SVGRPMPRLTYEPSLNSLAARAAICSRFQAMSVPLRADGLLLDPLLRRLLRRQRDDPVYEDAGEVHLVGVQLAGLDQLRGLADGDPARHRCGRVEVARGLAEDEVAVAVALPCAYEPEVGDDRLLQHERLLALSGGEGARLLGGRG